MRSASGWSQGKLQQELPAQPSLSPSIARQLLAAGRWLPVAGRQSLAAANLDA
jgi:hypothetical protein